MTMRRAESVEEFPAVQFHVGIRAHAVALWRHPALSILRYVALSALVAILFGGWRHLRRFHGGTGVGSNICGAPDAYRSGSSGAASGAP